MAERSLVYRFEGRFDNLKAGLAAGGKSVEDFNKKLMATDRQGAKTRAALGEIGDTAGRVGLAAAAGFAVAVGAAANFDQAMSRVSAATHASASDMEALRGAAIKAGADTQFSATEAAAAIEELSKAGVSTADILGGGLAGSMSLASAGSLEVGQAAEIAATALTQFGLAGKDIPHVADLLAAGAGKAQGDVSDLSQALNQSGLVAAQTGLSLEETVGTLSSFASAGLLGSDAGTSFKTMLQALTPTSEEASKLMSNLGISAYDAQGEFIGMSEFAGNLQASLADLSVEQQNAAMKTIFGSDAVRAANVLFKQGADGIDSWTAKVNDSGYAAETSARLMENLKGDLEKLGGALQTALIGAGDGAQGPLRELTQGATKAVDAFTKLPGPVQTSVTALLGVTAVLGGGLWFTSKAVSGVSNMRGALADLGVDADKTKGRMKDLGAAAGAAAGVVALATATSVLAESLDDARPSLEAMRSTLIALGQEQGSGATSMAQQFNDLGESIERIKDKSLNQSISDALQGVATGVGFSEASSLRNAKADIEALDSALASLVNDGKPELAKESLERIAAAQGLSSTQMNQLTPMLTLYNEGLKGQANESTLAATATQTLTTAQGQSVQMTEEQAEAFKGAQDAARETADSFLTLGESLNDPKVALTDWISQLETQAKALRDFTSNSQAAIKRGLSEGLVSELQAAGTEGALRMEQLANATDEEIARASRAFEKGESASNAFVDAVTSGLNEVNETTAKPHIEIDGGQAYVVIKGVRTKVEDVDNMKAVAKLLADGSSIPGAVAQAQATLNSLKSKDVWITTYLKTVTGPASQTKRSSKDSPPTMFSGKNPADGATITAFGGLRRADSGATVPTDGGAYYDRFPYLLAPLEEVISNRVGQASKYRPELKLINADAPPHMVAMSLAARMQAGRLAGGGTAGGRASGRAGVPPVAVGDIWGGGGIPDLGRAFGSLAQQVRFAEKAVKGSTAAMEREKSQRDALVSKRDAVGSDVSGKYMSELFSTQRDPFVKGAGGWKSTLQSDIAKYREQSALQAQAAKQGLKGEAFRELAGKATNQQIREMLKSGQAGEYQRLYNTRAAEASKAGSSAGQIAYGAEVAIANRELRDANKELRQQNRWLKALEKRAAQAEKDRKAAPGKTGAAAAKGASGAGNRGRSNVRE